MNILRLLDKLSDDKFFTTEFTRGEAIKSISKNSAKAALVTLPLGLGLISTSAKANSTSPNSTASSSMFFKSALTDALQFALILEYLEDEYYKMGLATPGLIASGDIVVFQQISKHEDAHVTFLKNTLTSLGETPGTKPTFDFTAGGNFDPFNDYSQFLAVAQAFEDTGVRAYKGQAGNVMANGTVLQAALQIHSVEARHASMVRRMRMNKGWIELNNGGNMPAATDPVYAGEENTDQAGFDTANLFGAEAGSAAYDEILTTSEVTAIADLFIV